MSEPKKNKGNNKGWNNLKPAKKGEVRNPKGRPKKEVCIPDILRKLLDDIDPYDINKKRTALEAMCSKLVKMGIGGNLDAIKIIFDRTEGKALERVIKQKVNDIVEIK